ncbi:MAG: UDP-3-O-(3-hydroxymyristoyl)glucosamine N-acyltransferase [Pseudomonadota bacterium]
MEKTLAEIAQTVNGVVFGNPDQMISGAAPFDDASDKDITFVAAPKFLKRMDSCKAGAMIVPEGVSRPGANLVVVKNPLIAFTKVLELLYPFLPQKPGIHPTAVVGERFVCGRNVSIGPFTAIADGVCLGDHVEIHPHVVIERNVVIGDHVLIHPHVTILERCRIGSRVIIHAGSVIGSDGFGFAPDGERWIKIPHKGIVQIDDDVEIGANNAIDRGTLGRTWIQKGVKTDNLVHIAHNVTVGENSVFAAQAGVAGSATLGRHTTVAGQAGITGHLKLGDNVTIGPQAGVTRAIPDNTIVSGSPEMPHKTWLRAMNIIPRLPEIKKQILELAKKVDRLEKNKDKPEA